MSQTTLPQPLDQPLEQFDSFEPDPQLSAFHYRPVPALAPVSLFLGVAAAIGLFGVPGLAVGVIGTVLAALCLVQIRRAEGELGGGMLAAIGLVLSVGFLATGSTLHAYTFATEVPEGYERVNFNRDISQKGFVFEGGQRRLHPDVQALDGQKIFVKGFMWRTGASKGLTSFLLLKDNGECCFGGDPQPTDMIVVKLQGGKTVDAIENQLVSVAGVLRCSPDVAPMEPVYFLEATLCERSRSAF